MSLYKKYSAEVKAVKDENGQYTGEIEFYASIYGNVDFAGDRVMPGAFDASLEKWRASGKNIPIVFSHKWDSLFDIVGWADPNDVTSDDVGLLFKGKLQIEENPNARYLHTLIDGKAISEASFAFDVILEDKGEDKANDLKVLDLIEGGPCLKGMNEATGDHPMLAKSRRKQTMPGSFEERERAVMSAVHEYFQELGAYGAEADAIDWSYSEATFPDRVIVCTYSDAEENTYYQFPYTVEDDGTVTLGDPQEVDLALVVTPVVAEEKTSETDAGGGDATVVEPDYTDKRPKSVGTVTVQIVPDLTAFKTTMQAIMDAVTSQEENVKTDLKDAELDGGDAETETEDAETPPTPEAKGDTGEDDVDTDQDDDAHKPNEEAEAQGDEKSTAAADEGESDKDKTEEPAGAKVEDLDALKTRMLVELLAIDAELGDE